MFHFRLLQVTTALVMGVGTVEAAEMPKFDLTAACRGSSAVETRAKCMQDEQEARDQLAKLWPQFKQPDASRCVHIVTTGGAANYTELLACLQAARIEENPKLMRTYLMQQTFRTCTDVRPNILIKICAVRSPTTFRSSSQSNSI